MERVHRNTCAALMMAYHKLHFQRHTQLLGVGFSDTLLTVDSHTSQLHIHLFLRLANSQPSVLRHCG